MFMVVGWLLLVVRCWLVVGGWWLVVGGWWLVVGGWYKLLCQNLHRNAPCYFFYHKDTKKHKDIL